MPDREKVIKALELCTSKIETRTQTPCETCPYHNKKYHGVLGDGCCNARSLQRDAIALLKAQEPRVMKLGEIREGEVCWFDCPGDFILRPVICNMYDRGDSSYLNFIWQHGNFSWKICKYERTWRCWTARPTNEQMEKEPWKAND